MLINDYKTYKFDFGNSYKFIISHLYQFMANLGIMFFLGVGHMFIMSTVVNPINNETLRTVVAIPVFLVFFCADLFLIVLTFMPKKVILTDNAIKVQRNSIPYNHIRRGFNDYILYYTIESCEFCYYPESVIDSAVPFIKYNKKSLVKIKDKYHGYYYIPVKNAEEFIYEVNKRIANLNDSSQSEANK